MTKKKNPAKTVSVEPVEQIDPTPQDDVPSRQVEDAPVEQPAETVVETAPIVEPEVQEAEPEKSAEVELQPVVDVKPVPTPTPVTPSKPKPLTMNSLHTDLEALRQIVDQQAILIKQLLEAPVRQRKPPVSNGKIQIKDTKTGKIYPSKNNVYQSLLKAGELEDLVKQGLFGDNPYKNSFGCYNLFRAYPNRFVEVHNQEQSV